MTPPIRWLHRKPTTGPFEARWGRQGEHLVAEWDGIGLLRATDDGSWSEFTPAEGADATYMRERMAVRIRAMLRQLQGGITLHASSIRSGSFGAAFLGESMSGKSTLAAQLCASPRYELLADSVMELSFENASIGIAPTEDSHWLRPDIAAAMKVAPEASGKVRMAPAAAARSAVPLAAILVLVFDAQLESASLRPVRGAQAFASLSLATYRLAMDIPRLLEAELNAFARIVRDVPMFELRRPPGLEHLDESPPIVEGLVSRLGASK